MPFLKFYRPRLVWQTSLTFSAPVVELGAVCFRVFAPRDAALLTDNLRVGIAFRTLHRQILVAVFVVETWRAWIVTVCIHHGMSV